MHFLFVFNTRSFFFRFVHRETRYPNNNNNNNNNNFICIAVYTKALYRFTIKKENN